MTFRYEALTRGGSVQAATIDAAGPDAAVELLRQQGLMPLTVNPAAPSHQTAERPGFFGKPNGRDLLLFSRQMKMLLESGASVVPALEACERGTRKPRFRAALRELREQVENGGTLCDAVQGHPEIFNSVYCSMIAAGEATATLPRSFGRMSDLTYRHEQTRRMLVGATVYPAALSLLCVAVVGVLVGFVVPRFRGLFAQLNRAMPASTQVMFAASDVLRDYWPVLTGALAATVTGVVLAWRAAPVRRAIDRWIIRAPLIGPLIRKLEFGRVLRVWAAMLSASCPLIDTLDQARNASRNHAMRDMLDRMREGVTAGDKIGHHLRESPLVDPIIASAISTGEENGRLADACEFVSSWVDDDNARTIATLTRVVEPLMLAIMGAIVGVVAMGLFLPLFDMAAMAG